MWKSICGKIKGLFVFEGDFGAYTIIRGLVFPPYPLFKKRNIFNNFIFNFFGVYFCKVYINLSALDKNAVDNGHKEWG